MAAFIWSSIKSSLMIYIHYKNIITNKKISRDLKYQWRLRYIDLDNMNIELIILIIR